MKKKQQSEESRATYESLRSQHKELLKKIKSLRQAALKSEEMMREKEQLIKK
jgi:hypothetical protein